MPSPGCPYDNAVMENFFGTLKTECLFILKPNTQVDVETSVAQYVYFYNFECTNLKTALLLLKSGARLRYLDLSYDRAFLFVSIPWETVHSYRRGDF